MDNVSARHRTQSALARVYGEPALPGTARPRPASIYLGKGELHGHRPCPIRACGASPPLCSRGVPNLTRETAAGAQCPAWPDGIDQAHRRLLPPRVPRQNTSKAAEAKFTPPVDTLTRWNRPRTARGHATLPARVRRPPNAEPGRAGIDRLKDMSQDRAPPPADHAPARAPRGGDAEVAPTDHGDGPPRLRHSRSTGYNGVSLRTVNDEPRRQAANLPSNQAPSGRRRTCGAPFGGLGLRPADRAPGRRGRRVRGPRWVRLRMLIPQFQSSISATRPYPRPAWSWVESSSVTDPARVPSTASTSSPCAPRFMAGFSSSCANQGRIKNMPYDVVFTSCSTSGGIRALRPDRPGPLADEPGDGPRPTRRTLRPVRRERRRDPHQWSLTLPAEGGLPGGQPREKISTNMVVLQGGD